MRSFMMILGLLFIAQSSFAQTSEASVAEPPTSAPLTIAPRADEPADEPAEWLDYKYELGRTIELSCKPGGGAEAPPNIFKWKANGTDVAQVASLANRYKLTEGDAVLVVERATEDDWGNFTCTLSGKVVARGYRVRARPVLRLPADSNVVEGQKQKLTCRVFGRPYPVVTWTYAAALGDHENQTNVVDRLGDRGLVQASAAGVEGAELVIQAAERADAGVYTCHAEDAMAPAATTLRVKDMYAALWPFLGICAEVFILCAIILVYEKRRTKPELDDSDTDNHEQ